MNATSSRRVAPLAALAATLVGLAATIPARGAVARAPRPAPVALDAPQAPGEPALYDPLRVHDFQITFPAGDWLATLEANGCSERGGAPSRDIAADLAVDGELELRRIGVRCKGNSSRGINGPKKPLNLTIDAFEAGQDLWGFDVINLNNSWNDASQLRDAIGLKLLGQFMPVSRFGFAKVTIDGQYVGLYSMVEQINSEWSEDHLADSGLVVRGDSPQRIAFNSSTLNWKGEDLTPYKAGYEVKGRADDETAGYEAVRELTRALDSPESDGGLVDSAFEEGIHRRLNVDSALWHLAGSSLIAHFDSYYVGKNFYLFAGQRDPRFHVIIWDLGLAFGTFGLQSGGMGGGGGGAPAAEADPFAQETAANRPLIRRLLAVPAFRADYLAHYRAMLHAAFTEEWVLEVGQSYQDVIKDAAKAEEAANGSISGSFSYDQFLANLREPVTGTGGGRPGRGLSPPGILALVKARRDFLLARDDMTPTDLSLTLRELDPAVPQAGWPSHLRADFGGAAAAEVTGVELRYQVDRGPEVRVGMSRTGDSWHAHIRELPGGSTLSYFLRVELAGGRAEFFPAANYRSPFTVQVAGAGLPQAPAGDLVINELMAENTATVADEGGKFGDWLELYNRGSAPVSLAGLSLGDDAQDPWAFALPARDLAPGEHLLVWCDGDVDEGELHATFRLDRKGETLVLASSTHILDSVTYPELAADQSHGRASSGAADWATCGVASPRAANHCDGLPAPTPTARPSQVPPTSVPTGFKAFLPFGHR